MKTLLIYTIVFLFITEFSMASTFVGNGGNVGDVELQVALRSLEDITSQLLKINNEIKNLPPNTKTAIQTIELCTCPKDLKNHPMCEPLLNLTPAQVKFCSAFLNKQLQALLTNLQTRTQLDIRWTNNNIEVQDNNYLRAADAVTNWQNKTLTINQNRFIKLQANERVFLLAHELMHLLDDEQGAKLQDTGAIGPFTNTNGGREFINAMAASLTVEAIEQDVTNHYSASLYRSRATEDIWLDLALGVLATGTSGPSPFVHSQHNQTGFGVRYQITPKWGIGFNQRQVSKTSSTSKGIKSEESLTGNQLGLSYRVFPSSDIISIFGQSHFIFSANIELLKGKLKLSDDYLQLSDDTQSTGFVLDGRYYLAQKFGFWLFGGLSLIKQKYSYEFALDAYGLPNYEVTYASQQYLIELGLSYGF